MGGELQECGCYDGPLSEEDQRLVSIRCKEHLGHVGNRMGYILMTRRNRNAKPHEVSQHLRPPGKMAVPKGGKRGRRR